METAARRSTRPRGRIQNRSSICRPTRRPRPSSPRGPRSADAQRPPFDGGEGESSAATTRTRSAPASTSRAPPGWPPAAQPLRRSPVAAAAPPAAAAKLVIGGAVRRGGQGAAARDRGPRAGEGLANIAGRWGSSVKERRRRLPAGARAAPRLRRPRGAAALRPAARGRAAATARAVPHLAWRDRAAVGRRGDGRDNAAERHAAEDAGDCRDGDGKGGGRRRRRRAADAADDAPRRARSAPAATRAT